MFSSRGPANRDPNSFALFLEAARSSGKSLLDLTGTNPTTCGFAYGYREIAEALSERGLEQQTGCLLRQINDPEHRSGSTGAPGAAESAPSPCAGGAFSSAVAVGNLIGALGTYQPDPRGLRGAREAVVGLWAERGIRTFCDRVVLTASTSEAYAWLFKLLCDPGDEVLAPQPSYPLFELLAAFEAVRLRPYPLRYDGAWHIDLDALRAAVTPRTRAVLVVSPNNPTGSYLARDELAALAELGFPIVCDEVFADYPLCDNPRRVRSVLEQRDGLVFALDGLSKLAALPQLKLGWITVGGRDDLVAEATARLELIADTYLSVGAPVQLAAPRLLELRHATHRSIAARLRHNLELLRGAFAGTAATVLHVEGGWSAIVRLPRVATESQWVLALLEDGVVVQPGWFYDFTEAPMIVVSLLTPTDEMHAGAERIVARVARWCG